MMEVEKKEKQVTGHKMRINFWNYLVYKIEKLHNKFVNFLWTFIIVGNTLDKMQEVSFARFQINTQHEESGVCNVKTGKKAKWTVHNVRPKPKSKETVLFSISFSCFYLACIEAQRELCRTERCINLVPKSVEYFFYYIWTTKTH